MAGTQVERRRHRRWHDNLPRWAANVVVAGAWWSLISILAQHLEFTVWIDIAFIVLGVPVSPSVFTAIVLALLSSALRRRLRVAWRIALFLTIGGVFAYGLGAVIMFTTLSRYPGQFDVQWADYAVLFAAMIGCLVVSVILIAAGSAFRARARRGSLRQAFGVLVLGLFLATFVTFLLSFIPGGTLHGIEERAWWAVSRALGISLPFGGDGGHAGPQWVAVFGGLMAGGAVVAALATFLRSANESNLMSADEELRVRALLAENGDQDSLGYFGTRRDKAVVFSEDGAAAITYRVINQVGLAAADPIGPQSAWPGVIAAWKRDMQLHAWHPAALACSEAGAKAYVEAGLRARAMGDEAVIDIDQFSLEGRAMRPVKRAVARVREAGCDITVRRHADIPDGELETLGNLADEWRGDEPDRGFSMALNRFGDPTDGRCVLVLVSDQVGEPIALQSFVPWGSRGLSLDVMRRSPQAVNGVNEAIVAALVEAAPDLGVRRISLNFAMFRSVFADAEQVGAGVTVRLADKVLGLASRFWQLDSLYRSNAKYLPRWVPRFVCFDPAVTLTQVGLAAARAEGFLPGPTPKVARTSQDAMIDPATGAAKTFTELVAAQDVALLTPAPPIHRLTEQQQVRHDKMAILAQAGMESYPVAVPRTTSIAEARVQTFGSEVSVAGRVRAIRDFGGVVFVVLEEDGTTIQALLSNETSRAVLPLWRQTVDLGDVVSITGRIGTSRKGELSVLVSDWCMASKCLRPLPNAHTGLTDPEARVRQRYLDLIVNRESMDIMLARSRGVAELRASFTRRGFIEVETPMLQAIHGGASARPFRTHLNAYNADLYLRIAPELSLKNLCVGGMNRIFELNRNFRNEGADATHNPEFTSVEAYAAYEDYNSMRVLTRHLILDVATAVHGEPVALRPGPDGTVERIRLDTDWPVVTVHDAVSRAAGEQVTSTTPVAQLRDLADRLGVHYTSTMSAGEIVLELYDELVEGQTTIPTFYTDFPLETSPLARKHRHDPALSERWDLVAFGAEIGTAYSELTDPVDQRNRLVEQSMKAAAGDPEAMEVDEAFLTALEYSMPPTGGLGIGVDRLIMMLCGTNIRATLAFPFVRPTESQPAH